MPETTRTQRLEEWFSAQSPDIPAAIASRLAMRLLPYGLVQYNHYETAEMRAERTTSLLRLNALTRAVLKTRKTDGSLPPVGSKLYAGQSLGDRHASDLAALGAMWLAQEQRDATASSYAADLAVSFDHLSGLVDSVMHDCTVCRRDDLEAGQLLALPLWSGQALPAWQTEADNALFALWEKDPGRYGVWLDWYRAILRGGTTEWAATPEQDKAIMEQLLATDETFWSAGKVDPDRVSGRLGQWIRQAGLPTGPDAVREMIVAQALGQYDTPAARPTPEMGMLAELEKFRDKNFHERLSGHPRPWAQAIALRSVLRALPLAIAFERLRSPREFVRDSGWSAFALSLINWSATKYGFVGSRLDQAAKSMAVLDAGLRRDEPAQQAVRLLAAALLEADDRQAVEGAFAACTRAIMAVEEGGHRFIFENVALAEADEEPTDTWKREVASIGQGTRGLMWNECDHDLILLKNGATVSHLLAQPLWSVEIPDWMLRVWRGLRERSILLGWEFKIWGDWYDRRLHGQALTFDFRETATDLAFVSELLGHRESFWQMPAREFSLALRTWVNGMRGPANPLDGDIDVTLSDDETDPDLATVAEDQNEAGLSFETTPSGAFDVDESAGASDLLTDQVARDSHAELKETLEYALTLCSGHNQASAMVRNLTLTAALMGNSPVEVSIGRFMQQAEQCLKKAAAIAIELRANEDLSALPGTTREIVIVLEAVPTAYWAMVHADPKLEQRLRDLSERSFQPAVSPSIGELRDVIQQSVVEGVLTPHAAELVDEMAEGLEDDPAADPRRANRFIETVKNVPRAVVSWLWRNKVRIGTGAVAGATALEGSAQGVSTAGRWLLAHSDWLHRLFAGNHAMIEVIDKLIAWAKLLPPA